jgi:hypothetical protein
MISGIRANDSRRRGFPGIRLALWPTAIESLHAQGVGGGRRPDNSGGGGLPDSLVSTAERRKKAPGAQNSLRVGATLLHGGYEWLSVKIFGEGRLEQDLPGKSPAFPQASITDPPIPPPRRQSKKHSFFTSIPEIITFLDPHSFRQCFFSFPAIFTQDLSVLFVGTVDFSGIGLAPARLKARKTEWHDGLVAGTLGLCCRVALSLGWPA